MKLKLFLNRSKTGNMVFIRNIWRRMYYVFLFCFFLTQLIYADDSLKEIDAINNTHTYDYIVTNLRSSISSLTDNLHKARQENYVYGEATTLSKLGLAYYFAGKYDLAAECYIKAFELFDQLHNYNELSAAYGEFGYQLKRQDLQKAIRYMQLAIGIAESFNLSDELRCKLYDNYGVLKEMNNEYDSAFVFYSRALRMKEQRNDIYGIPYSLNKIAGLLALQKNYTAAYQYLRRSDEYRRKENTDYGRSENLSLWADIFFMQHKYDSAAIFYQRALELAQANGYAYLQQYCYEKMAKTYQLKNDFRNALFYYQKYVAQKESIDNKVTREKIAELEIAYETAQKDIIIARKEAEIQWRTNWLLIAIVAVIILSALVVLIYYYQKNKRKREKEEMELRNRLREAELTNTIAAEKLRISRELHDNIGARITLFINYLDTLHELKHKIEREVYELLRNYGKETLNELRTTIWAIKIESGTLKDLIYRIRNLGQNMMVSEPSLQINISSSVDETLHLSSLHMLNLYRIIQEACQNIIKHSGATKAEISFSRNYESLLLRICDNGKGFNVETVAEGNGIANMKARCEEINGIFNIMSSSSGTTIECVFEKI